MEMIRTFHEPRTSGDGMDNTVVKSPSESGKNVEKFNFKSSQYILKSMQPITPKDPVIKSVPKYVPKERKKPKCLIGKPREPKFVPYEPYKGAVQPIVLTHKPVKREKLEKNSKNNIDIHRLASHISEMRALELKKMDVLEKDSHISKKQWEKEKMSLENDIKNLRESNAHLENQLKLQTQVNTELKTLLVAAVGEDLESRVEHLTADKLQLARALLDSANHLTSHQEQTEWLSGQCEVWRSKFLASSLMVEELAKWKSALSSRMTEYNNTMRKLLEERNEVHCSSLQIYKNLNNILNNLKCNNVRSMGLKSTNIIDLTEINHFYSDCIDKSITRQNNSNDQDDLDEILNMSRDTQAELEALNLLKNPVSLPEKPDVICNALMGAALSIGGGQMFLQHPTLHATCCSHCTGEIQNL